MSGLKPRGPVTAIWGSGDTWAPGYLSSDDPAMGFGRDEWELGSRAHAGMIVENQGGSPFAACFVCGQTITTVEGIYLQEEGDGLPDRLACDETCRAEYWRDRANDY